MGHAPTMILTHLMTFYLVIPPLSLQVSSCPLAINLQLSLVVFRVQSYHSLSIQNSTAVVSVSIPRAPDMIGFTNKTSAMNHESSLVFVVLFAFFFLR